MEYRTLIEHMDRLPFEPFILEFENGRTCTVLHPENILFWPSRVRFDHVQAYDEEQDRTVYFEASAVTAIRKERAPRV